MYREIMREIGDYIFVEDEPKEADIILIPGNGYPQMAEQAARLYRDGYAPVVLPSGSTVSHWENLVVYCQKAKNIPEIILQNGNFCVMFSFMEV